MAFSAIFSSALPSASAHDAVTESIGVVESDADAILPAKDGSLVTLKDVRWNGSGVMISPCLMLTANHVIFGNTGHYDDAYDHDIRVSIGRHASRRQLRAHPIAHGILPVPIVENGKWKNEDQFKAEDWAIIRVDACQGPRRARHWLALSNADHDDRTGRLFGFYDTSFGRAWNIKPRLVTKGRCRYRGSQGSALATTDCPSREGMSGGPCVDDKNDQVAAIVNSNGYGVIDGGPDELKSPTFLLTVGAMRRAAKARYGCDLTSLISADISSSEVCGVDNK